MRRGRGLLLLRRTHRWPLPSGLGWGRLHTSSTAAFRLLFSPSFPWPGSAWRVRAEPPACAQIRGRDQHMVSDELAGKTSTKLGARVSQCGRPKRGYSWEGRRLSLQHTQWGPCCKSGAQGTWPHATLHAGLTTKSAAQYSQTVPGCTAHLLRASAGGSAVSTHAQRRCGQPQTVVGGEASSVGYRLQCGPHLVDTPAPAPLRSPRYGAPGHLQQAAGYRLQVKLTGGPALRRLRPLELRRGSGWRPLPG